VWLGASIEDMRVAERAAILAAVPARVRFVSYEPALGPLDDMPLTGIDWVIYGGESGPRRRPEDKAWARSMRDRCRAAGIAFWHKQSAHRRPGRGVALGWRAHPRMAAQRPVAHRHGDRSGDRRVNMWTTKPGLLLAGLIVLGGGVIATDLVVAARAASPVATIVVSGLALALLAGAGAVLAGQYVAGHRERQRIARCRAVGMDDELAGLLGRALPSDRIDLALAHWSDPAVVAQWRDEGWFELREDGHVLFFCQSLQRSVGGRSQPRSRARRA